MALRAGAVGLGAVVVVSFVALGGCGVKPPAAVVGAHSSHHQTAVVPWVDRPAPRIQPSTPSSPVADYRACSARQLGIEPGRAGPAGGTDYDELRLVDDGLAPCTLSGGPTAVVERFLDGRKVRAATGSDDVAGANLMGPGPANVLPGDAGWVTLSFADACPAAVHEHHAELTSLALVLTGGGRVAARFPDPLNVVCGLLVSPFGAPLRTSADRSPLNVLRVTAHMPASIPAGSVTHYIVSLHNKSSHDLVLSPCPSYAEFLTPARHLARRVVESYYLNCAAVPSIAAGQTRTFAMQMQMDPQSTGLTKYLWQLQGANPASGGTTQIG